MVIVYRIINKLSSSFGNILSIIYLTGNVIGFQRKTAQVRPRGSMGYGGAGCSSRPVYIYNTASYINISELRMNNLMGLLPADSRGGKPEKIHTQPDKGVCDGIH